MTFPARTNKDKVDAFWEKYTKLLIFNGIKRPFDRWYSLKAKHYIKAHSNLKLVYHTGQNIDDWLTELGRNNDLEVWQFRQVVFSLKILFDNYLHLAWARHFPWDRRVSDYSFQFNSALPVAGIHSSTSTDFMFYKERNDNSLLGLYSELLEPMVKCIRLKHYSNHRVRVIDLCPIRSIL